jgi:tRNA pseudouridine32 synthase/23S rRNA pseudouridine746 synthase
LTAAQDSTGSTPSAADRFECHLDIDESQAGSSAVDVLVGPTALSRQSIKRAMQKGAVWLTRRQGTRRLRRADKRLQSGDRLHLYHDPQILVNEPPAARLIADEGAFSIWYKPGGMFSQGSKWGDHCTLSRWVETHLRPQRPAFVVHRLDRAATGLMIIAHARHVAAAFAAMFERRELEKTYTAVVSGRVVEPQRLAAPIDDRPAISHVRPLQYDAAAARSLLEVRIETGRKHQIRRHLAEAGHPIVGDRLFGQSRTDAAADLCLTASSLAFVSPVDVTPRRYALPVDLQLSLEQTSPDSQ